ncbi:MAG: (2Fe-2S)-binding protein [Verrucomicrobiota bacterium]
MNITLKLNGESHELRDVDPSMPLLWAIRDILGLTGTKYGCGMAQCGACTIHLNDTPTRSCIMPITAAQNAEITTIEGLSPDGTHPVQQAWIDEDVPQCGYCQAGQIMSAVALLKSRPDPTDDDIDQFMRGNLCRCGTYPRIRKAIKKAAKQISK